MSDNSTPRKSTPRLIKVILTLSLGLNLLVMGQMGLGPFIGAFTPAQRREIGHALRSSASSATEAREALWGEAQAMLKVLRQEPFEPADLGAVLEAQSQRLRTRVTAARAIMVEHIAAMSPADRARFADRLERGLHGAMARAHQGRHGGRERGEAASDRED